MGSIMRKFKDKTDKRTLMMRNGASVLKELIASSHGKYNPYRIFSATEVEIATNNYDGEKVIIEDGIYKLYKGFWQERQISIMKFYDHEDGHRRAYECCINNIIYAARMSHNHILKLIGCCLETPIPILVFESVEHGILRHRILGAPRPQFDPLILKHWLKIAMDIAHALAYLHLGFSRPIVFRGFQTEHILINEENVAKLFDFSQSISIPEGETYITDRVMGSLGHCPPESLSTGVFNEKSDVFIFGVFLFGFLIGRNILDLQNDARDLACPLYKYLKKYFEDNRFTETVAPLIVQDRSCIEKEQQLQAFAQLTFECFNDSPVDRPTMIDVAKKLRQIYCSCV